MCVNVNLAHARVLYGSRAARLAFLQTKQTVSFPNVKSQAVFWYAFLKEYLASTGEKAYEVDYDPCTADINRANSPNVETMMLPAEIVVPNQFGPGFMCWLAFTPFGEHLLTTKFDCSSSAATRSPVPKHQSSSPIPASSPISTCMTWTEYIADLDARCLKELPMFHYACMKMARHPDNANLYYDISD